MEPNTFNNEPTPQNNEPSKALPIYPGEPPIKHRQNKLLAIGIGCIGLLLLAGFLVANKSTMFNKSPQAKKTNTNQPAAIVKPAIKEVEQAVVNPGDGNKILLSQNDFYAVTLGNSQIYYGRVNKISDDYLRLTPVAYKKDNVLILNGKGELHNPEPGAYVRIAKVTKLQKLGVTQEDATIKNLLQTNPTPLADAFPAQDINAYLKQTQFQAFFFADGTIYFAKTANINGKFLAGNSHVYYLNYQKSAAISSTSQQVSMVLAQPAQIANLSDTDLLYWQNLKADSQITKAALEYEKSQPKQ